MRQQPSDTKKKPSRFCKFLLLLVGFKLCLLAVVLVEPFVSFSSLITSTLPSAKKLAALSNDTSAEKPDALIAQAKAPESAAVQEVQPKAGAAFAASVDTPPAQQSQSGVGKAPNQPGNLTLDALNRKQEELARREQDLRALEQELDARIIQLQALEQRLQTMLRDAEETKGEKYKHLIDVLANMKARQAAEVLETLDEKIAVRVLAGMRGRQAGEILTFASPTKAARLTEALARMQMPLE